MGTLPDIDDGNVETIAYYNILEETSITSITPTNILDTPNLTEITLFDNGIVGTYEGPTRDIEIRFKTDGWISAHLQQVSDTFETNTGSTLNGTYDIIDTWSRQNDSLSQMDVLSNAIVDCLGYLDNWGEVEDEFSQEDINLYSYEYPQTDNMTLMSARDQAGTTSSYTNSYSFVVSDTTNVQYGVVTGAGNRMHWLNDLWGDFIDSEGNQTRLVSSSGCGVIDITDIPANETCELQWYVDQYNFNSSAIEYQTSVFVMWG